MEIIAFERTEAVYGSCVLGGLASFWGGQSPVAAAPPNQAAAARVRMEWVGSLAAAKTRFENDGFTQVLYAKLKNKGPKHGPQNGPKGAPGPLLPSKDPPLSVPLERVDGGPRAHHRATRLRSTGHVLKMMVLHRFYTQN